MTVQDTEFQAIPKSGTLNFSCKESYVAEYFQLTTPRDVLSNAKGEANRQKVMRLQSLLGEARKQFIMNSFALSYPACIIGSDGRIESFSGLINIIIKVTADRSLADIRTLLKQTPYVYLIKSNIEESGLYVWMQAEEIPVDEEHYQAYFNAALRLLRKAGITDSELSLADSDPLAPCWETYDGEIWTDFYPIAKISLDTVSTVSEGQSVRVDSTEHSQTDTIREGIHAEQQRAQEQQANQTANPKEPDKQPGNRPTVGAFPVDIFSESLQVVIEQTGLHMNFRADWIGSAILYAICVAVGNCYGTRYKKYEQKASMYLAIVGEPGTNKSAPFQYALAPLQERDDEWYRLYKDQLVDYTRWSRLSKKDREAEGLPADREAPEYKTLLVSDVTQEFLVQTHAQNPIGIGLFMDELAGWFKNFTRYSNGSEEQFWLSVWSLIPTGSGRKGSGVNKIPQPLLPVGGTIQPGVLSELSRDGRDQNGFIDRLLFAYPDSQVREYDSETELDSSVTTYYKQFVNKLLSLRDSALLDEKEKVKTIWLPFADDAFIAMRKWKNTNTDAINRTSVQALKGLLSKLDMYCIRFALMIELMDWACDQLEVPAKANELAHIRLTSVDRAIILTDYFRQNAEKVYYELNEQTPDERLPSDRQRLFKALPDEVETGEAVTIAAELEPPVSESTVKRMLKDTKLFRRVGYGQYAKIC